MPNIPLWREYDDKHWLRDYGRTQVVVIDDQWFAEEHFGVRLRDLRAIEKKMNISFHFFTPPRRGGEWNDEWFKAELKKAKEICPDPCMVLLDLMYGEETSPLRGSGIRFLKYLSEDAVFAEVPVMVITAAEEDQALLKELKSLGGSFQNFLKKHHDTEPFAERLERGLLEYALLADPTIHAYSAKMRKVAQEMRKILLDPKLMEKVSINNEEITTSIPISVLFVGGSGDGKNHLAKALQKMSDRGNKPFQTLTCSDITDPEGFEKIISGCGPFTGFTGTPIRIDSRTGQRNTRGDINLAIVGMVTNVNGGTLILDELGNSVRELQRNLFRLLDSRQIKPLFISSEYIPVEQPYDVWVIVTMQPRHADFLEDLERRLNKMVWIDIPPLKDRKKDVIPIAAATLDGTKRPDELFTYSGLEWLKENYMKLSAGRLTAILSKVTLMSSIGFVNRQELEKAFMGWEKPIVVQAEAIVPQPNRIEFEEHKLPNMIMEHNRKVVDYLIESFERKKDEATSSPNYTQTWLLMTQDNTLKSKEIQLTIGKFIFELDEKDLVERMEKSAAFRKAVEQCGRLMTSKKDQELYEKLKPYFG